MTRLVTIVILLIPCLPLSFDGLISWSWGKSHCSDCGIYFKVNENAEFDDKVIEFKQALEDEKATILELYNSDPQEYNLLAWMALGILGQESLFFESGRYKIKETLPILVRLAKIAKAKFNNKSVTANSRGPTQIKLIPSLIKWHYNIQPHNLKQPRYAAVATVGFLIEALAELKNRARNNKLEFITPETYVDYLPYLYFGNSKQLTNRTATPKFNLYIKGMKSYMQKFTPYEVYF